MTGYGPRGRLDARGARPGAAAEDEEDTSSKGMGFGKALGIILLALILGAGAAYGYYMLSAPKPPATTTQPGASPATGASSSGLLAPGTGSGAYTLVYASGSL